jgi:oxygen-dependent protoporphyrinogen oxidase
VARIARRDGGFTLHLAAGGQVDAAALVLACGAQATARLVREFDGGLAHEVEAIAEPPVAVVGLGYPSRAIARPLDGFGFLVPRGQGLRMLGTLWESTIYPGRAPEEHALLRVMVGGATDPEVLRLPDDDLVALVRRELGTVMGVEGEPVLARVFRHAPGIPQYTAGHLARLDRIAARAAAHPGLFLAGMPYRGVSMPHCIEEAAALAPQVAAAAARGAAAQ